MKRAFSALLSLLLLWGPGACFAGGGSRGSDAETTTRETNAASETAVNRSETEVPTWEAEQETTTAALPETRSGEDFQAGIPEEYRLQINVPAAWNEPLPTLTGDFISPLFGVAKYLDQQQQTTTHEPVELPRVMDLFTISELESHFGMTAVLDEEGRNFTLPNEVKERYLFYETDTSSPALWSGKLVINLQDCGDRTNAMTFMTMFASEPREIEGLGEYALLSESNAVYILVAESVVLSVRIEFVSPEDRMALPTDEALLIDFARQVWERVMEKMSSPDR